MDEMWRRFKLALEPLKHAGELGAVLFQFPPWFYYRRSNLAHMAHCAQVLDGYQIAVEFRNRKEKRERYRRSRPKDSFFGRLRCIGGLLPMQRSTG